MAAATTETFPTWPWQHWATERPAAVAIHCEGQQFSWHETAKRVDEYAQGLIEQGLKRDQLVAVVSPNSLQAVWLLLAVLRVGARFVGINPRLSQAELDAQLAALHCDFVWYPAKSVLDLSGYTRLQLLPPDASRMVPVTWQLHRPATLTLTSGSTGFPKAVVHSAQTHLASAEGLLAWLPFDAEDSWLLSLPLFHISGMAIIWRWLARGARLDVCAPERLDAALAQVTHASLVPTQLQRLLDTAETTSLALKQVLLGGTMIPVSLTQQARQAGIECWCGYGMTEMASTVTAKPADDSSGVGTVLPNRELTLVDGEVMVKGETLCLGYYRQQTIFPIAEDEWFATRDLACWKGGELHILGRADNMFISGGENIQPEDIEKVLLQHPDVTQAVVLPVEDAEFGHRPLALIRTVGPLDEERKQQLRAYMAQQVTAFRRPVEYLAIPAHLSGSGIKLSRVALKAWLESERAVYQDCLV